MWLNLLVDDHQCGNITNFFVKKHCSAHKATNEAGLHDDNNDELNSL
jgi:hypothetical protein